MKRKNEIIEEILSLSKEKSKEMSVKDINPLRFFWGYIKLLEKESKVTLEYLEKSKADKTFPGYMTSVLGITTDELEERGIWNQAGSGDRTTQALFATGEPVLTPPAKVIYTELMKESSIENEALEKMEQIYAGISEFGDPKLTRVFELRFDILLAVLAEFMADPKIMSLLEDKGFDMNEFRKNREEERRGMLGNSGISPEMIQGIISGLENSDEEEDEDEDTATLGGKTKSRQKNSAADILGKSAHPFLDKYSHNMTEYAKDGKYDPMVGREKEVEQLVEILACRKKNNAVLIGDPGVGKTAIVEGLAQKILSNDIPHVMMGKELYSLDLNALVAGTKFRGQYEERLQGIIKEVRENPNIIVYIDEFHGLVGNGSAEGAGDGSNILKPYLARGEFQCIGSTTLDEYRKHVEGDGALKRRFQNIIVEEPSIEDTKKILGNLKEKYEDYHKVKYPQEILDQAVEWTGRFITDRFFPDKAIDAMDMVGARCKIQAAPQVDKTELLDLEEKINEAKERKNACIQSQDFDKASEYREEEKNLQAQLDDLLHVKDEEGAANIPSVNSDLMGQIIAKLSGVPVDIIGKSDLEKLVTVEASLADKVIGQSEAIKTLTGALKRNSLGLRDTSRPIASFLMVGPTGSGKTYLAKELARQFFGSEDFLIKYDMSEFGESHTVSKLTGATASYVGYDDAPLLEQIRRKPYSVILFDEIEKAAPEIFKIFLSILDEGQITLGNGIDVDFRNTIILFTGNIGTKDLQLKGNALGYSLPTTNPDADKERSKDILLKSIKKTFAPEFINRISKTIFFNKLSEDNMLKIFDLELESLRSRIKEAGYVIDITEDAKKNLVNKCDLDYGARDMKRIITDYVEDELCSAILDGLGKTDSKTVKVSLSDSGEVEMVLA